VTGHNADMVTKSRRAAYTARVDEPEQGLLTYLVR
jgi:hypothetical protein